MNQRQRVQISVAYMGELERAVDSERLRERLRQIQNKSTEDKKDKKKNKKNKISIIGKGIAK